MKPLKTSQKVWKKLESTKNQIYLIIQTILQKKLSQLDISEENHVIGFIKKY